MKNRAHNNRIKSPAKTRGLGPRYRSAVYEERYVSKLWKINMNLKLSLILLPLILTSACSSPYKRSMPENYTGPSAYILDTIQMDGESKGDFFYLSEIDGQMVKNARSETYKYTQGKGMTMYPVEYSRQVPALQNNFKIVGRTGYAAPILTLTGTVYEVEGIIKFTPAADKTYQIKGLLSESSSSVWIEDMETKEIISNKIQVKGSSELGFFSK